MDESKSTFAVRTLGRTAIGNSRLVAKMRLLPVIERHAAEVHNLTHFKPEAFEQVCKAIRRNSY
jgi:Protein of unknown function (DUF1059)